MLPNGKRTANLVGPASVGKQPTTIENAYELLGRPGEFYADPEARVIYYTPRKGEDLRHADVELPALETLLDISGSETAPVHNVTVRGLTFSYARWNAPSTRDGFSEIQANYRVTGPDGATRQALCTLVPGGTCPFAAWAPEPGNVRASFADNIRFERDTFTHLGAAGLAMMEGEHNNLIEGCVFTDVSGNGIELAGVDEPEAADARFAVHNRIENNLFRNVGAEFRGGIPIVVGYARYTHIAHNQIDTIPYAAISIGWGGWLDKIDMAGVTNRSSGNVIEKNRITHFMLVLSDGGGIYTQGRTGQSLTDGEVVAGNFLDDQVSTGHAIYTDNGSSMVKVRDNIIFHTNFDNWGSRHKNWYDGRKGTTNDPLAIEGNWWEQGDNDSDKLMVVEQGNHLVTSLAQVPAAIREQAGLERPFRSLLTPAVHPRVPESPSAVTAFITGTTAYVNWREPVDNGGSPVLHYEVKSSDGGSAIVTEAEFRNVAFAKFPLRQAGPHTFTVTAVNSAGASVASLPSRSIDPAAELVVPGELQKVSMRRDGSRLSVHFGTPKDHGEDLIAVDVAIDDEQHVHSFSDSRVVALEGRHVTFVTLDGLTPGPHKIGVAAVNGAGRGAWVWINDQDRTAGAQ
jgi:hypothetical protein